MNAFVPPHGNDPSLRFRWQVNFGWLIFRSVIALIAGFETFFCNTQYNSVSLHQHIAATYRFDQFSGGHVCVGGGADTDSDVWFQGTADAVRRSIRYFRDDQPDVVVILSGDQLYRMNARGD